MKKLLLLLAVAAMSSGAYCEVLTPEQALDRALSSQSLHRLNAKTSATPRLLKTYTEAAQPAVYLFSRGLDAGYLVISAETATDAVLAFCDSGNVDADNMPPSMTYWLNQYAEQIAYLRANPAPKRADSSTTAREDIAMMCQTKWNQETPFNNDCPYYIDSNNHIFQCVTGCVATAYAQVLKYHNWPTADVLASSEDATYSYNWADAASDHYVYDYDASTQTATQLSTLSYTYSNHVFDWDNMLNDYSGDYSDAQGAAVADLMKACGVLVNMNYGEESGAVSWQVIHTHKYMHLDDGLTIVYRDYYSKDDWAEMMYNALKVGPIMYGGSSSAGGHEFVCDGYHDGYFHINWGWGGAGDGYFMLDALDSSGNGVTPTAAGYNFNQDAILYIQPERTQSTTTYTMYCSDDFTISEESANLGGKVTVPNFIFSATTPNFNMQFLLKIVSEAGGDAVYAQGANWEASLGYGVQNIEYTLPTTLADGTYIVTPAFKVIDGDTYDVLCSNLYNKAYVMTVANGVCTFAEDGAASITASDFKINSKLATATTFNATATLTNDTDKDYVGLVAVALVDDSNTFIASALGVQVTVPAHSSYNLSYDGIITDINTFDDYTLNAGEQYKLVLAEVESSDEINTPTNIISNTVTVTAADVSTFKIYATNPVVNTTEQGVINRDNIVVTVDVTTNYYFSGFLHIYFHETVSPNAIVGAITGSSVVINNETKTLTFEGAVPELEYGQTYLTTIYCPTLGLLNQDNGYTALSRVTVSSEPEETGVTDVTADIVATELFNLQGTRINADNAAPGIYIKVDTLADGSHRTSKISIK